ncbi:hypothetical protein ASB57_20450 [Bordetella sp. N]|nr:hypothetical protein ASB57_20450 [Bordetella sp. N]
MENTVRATAAQEEAYQHCPRNLSQLIALLKRPEGQPRWKLRVVERLVNEIGTSNDMPHIETCLRDAVSALSSFHGGWNAHMAVMKQNTVKDIANALSDSLISTRNVTTDADRAARAARMAPRRGPLTICIVNALSTRFGLRKSDQPPGYDTTRHEKEFQSTLDHVRESADDIFKPSPVSYVLASEAMSRFLDYRYPPEDADHPSVDWTQREQDAACNVSKEMCGQEDVLRPASFLLRASKKSPLGSMSFPDNAALQFDLLAHMDHVGDLQGQPMVLGEAGHDADGPYRIVTDGELVWKVMVDAKAELSWAGLKDAPVKRASLAEFCAVEHQLSDESIPYRRLIGDLVARQVASDPDASMACIPPAYFEHPLIAMAIRAHLPAA